MRRAVLFVLLWAWVVLGLDVYDQSFGVVLPLWTDFPGVILMIAGGVLAILCIGVFVVHGKGTAAPFDPPREFVAVGPYRYVRNPMYIGGWGVLVGAGLILRSPSILGLAVLFL